MEIRYEEDCVEMDQDNIDNLLETEPFEAEIGIILVGI
jgi:hypothetical protein